MFLPQTRLSYPFSPKLPSYPDWHVTLSEVPVLYSMSLLVIHYVFIRQSLSKSTVQCLISNPTANLFTEKLVCANHRITKREQEENQVPCAEGTPELGNDWSRLPIQAFELYEVPHHILLDLALEFHVLSISSVWLSLPQSIVCTFPANSLSWAGWSRKQVALCDHHACVRAGVGGHVPMCGLPNLWTHRIVADTYRGICLENRALNFSNPFSLPHHLGSDPVPAHLAWAACSP